jgi:excisionase family DNA binding protein
LYLIEICLSSNLLSTFLLLKSIFRLTILRLLSTLALHLDRTMELCNSKNDSTWRYRMADTMGRYLRAGEVAELLGLSKKHVYLMSKQRKLPSVKFCGNLRFPS